MPRNNTKQSVPYDPKQRIVGGVVLSILMLLIYGFLKLMLGWAFGYQESFALKPPLVTEKISVAPGNENIRYLNVPQQFVFLDLNGNPLQNIEDYQQPEELEEPETSEKPEEDKSKEQEQQESQVAKFCTITDSNQDQWYVQAASFKDEEFAKRLAQRIKDKNIAEEGCLKQTSNGYWLVRLPTHTDIKIVEQQKQQLRQLLKLKGVIRKIKKKVTVEFSE